MVKSSHRRLAAAGGFVLVLCGCNLLQPEPIEAPAVSLQAVELEAAGLNSQIFRARLGLFNPNPFALDVTGGEVTLELAGIEVARGRTLAPFVVQSGAEEQVDIQVTTHLLRDSPALFRVLTRAQGADSLDYRLRGHVEVVRRGPDRVPIEAEGRLRLPSGGLGETASPRL